jgi:hypothetical protein
VTSLMLLCKGERCPLSRFAAPNTQRERRGRIEGLTNGCFEYSLPWRPSFGGVRDQKGRRWRTGALPAVVHDENGLGIEGRADRSRLGHPMVSPEEWPPHLGAESLARMGASTAAEQESH